MAENKLFRNRCCFGLFAILWYGFLIAVAFYAIKNIAEGTEYAQNGTEETCSLIDYAVSNCTYSCGNKGGSTCLGTQYEYEAVVPSKCGNVSIFSSEADKYCPGTLMDPGADHVCYVLDCDEQEFTFISPGYYLFWGVVFLVVILFCGCVPVITGLLPCLCRDKICPKTRESKLQETQG